MAKNKTINIEAEAINIVRDEKNQWETGTVFVTEKVAFDMRNLIRQCRKNYWGVFDEIYDPQTGRKKIWIPLTESIVEATVKNIDIDTKDLKVVPKKENRGRLNVFVREYTKNKLKEINFGEKLDQAERQLSIDGTVVWKIIETGKGKDKKADIRIVDLLNFYIDPTVSSIEEAESVIERAVMTPQEIKSMSGWINTDGIEGQENLSRSDEQLSNTSSSRTVKLIEVFERWGLMPKSLITGKDSDKDEVIMGHIVVSGINAGDQRVHLIEKADKKPYEECWFTKISNRWYGKGQAEKLLMLQLYQNMIVNIRITRSQVSQLGLFKIKKNKGITPQKLSRLPVNGAVLVDDMDDIQQFVMQEASQASYNDENVAQSWAEKVTQAFEIVTGETLPATTTATVGAIQSKSAASAFVLIKEGIGMWLDRVINKHLVPIYKNTIKKGDLIRFTSSGEELRELNEQIADVLALSRANDYGVDFIQDKIDIFKKLESMGSEKHIMIDKDIDLSEYDFEFYVGDESYDENLKVTNLINMMKIAPQFGEQIATKIFDILGINIKMPTQEAQIAQGQVAQAVGAGGGQINGATNPTAQVTEANTLQ